MLGAIYGDIIGSYYEIHCTKEYHFELHRESSFTDDSVMTAAVCKAILINPNPVPIYRIQQRAFEYAAQYKQFFSYFHHAGYGAMFTKWASEKSMIKQRSFGNGAAMRAAPIGYAYHSLEQVHLQAKASCLYTHRHRKAIKGTKAVASAVWLARHGNSKDEIKTYLEHTFQYRLDAKLNTIRPGYSFDSSTDYTVPPAIIAFLESRDYESAVRNAVSLGGDADTMACIAGAIAEAFYHHIPKHIQDFCNRRLDPTIKNTVNAFYRQFGETSN